MKKLNRVIFLFTLLALVSCESEQAKIHRLKQEEQHRVEQLKQAETERIEKELELEKKRKAQEVYNKLGALQKALDLAENI